MNETLSTELKHPDRNVRSQAVIKLGKLADADTLPALLDALRTENDFFVQEDITWALVAQGEAAIQPLIELLDDESPITRHHATHTLTKIGGARVTDALLHTLEDEEITVITKAAFGLGQSGDVRAIPALVRLLGHENREVQTTIINVLERFEDAAVMPLIQALSHERWQVREQAADILGLIGDQQAAPMLIHALSDSEWQVRFAAVTALGYVGGAVAKNALRQVQNDPEQKVRELAPKVMRRMKA
jgi:HEAT repeat protein